MNPIAQATRECLVSKFLNEEHLLKELKSRKIHLYPRLFSLLPPDVAEGFDSQWSPVVHLANHLAQLPCGALHFLLTSPTGALVVSHTDALHYARGLHQLHKSRLENVAFIPAASLLGDGTVPLHIVAHLYDHLLGSAGADDGANLSDGVGITPAWTEVGAQVLETFALGYNPDPLCQKDRADYFAQSVAWYALRPKELNVADPPMYKLLKRSFFSETFWR